MIFVLRARLSRQRTDAGKGNPLVHRVIVCDAAQLSGSDLETVEALARLQLEARRRGFRVQLRHVPPELAELLELCGLAEVLRLGDALGVDAGRQAEHREEAGGVQEEGDAGDPVA